MMTETVKRKSHPCTEVPMDAFAELANSWVETLAGLSRG